MKGGHRLVDIRNTGHHPAGLPGVQRQRVHEGPQQVQQEHDHKGMLHIKIRLMNYAFQIWHSNKYPGLPGEHPDRGHGQHHQVHQEYDDINTWHVETPCRSCR